MAATEGTELANITFTDAADTTITYYDATPPSTSPLFAGGTLVWGDEKTERLAKRVEELETHICDLIDIVAQLRAALYDA